MDAPGESSSGDGADKPGRHGAAWSVAEEKQLYDEFVSGIGFAEIAAIHERTIGGIRSCLRKLGVLDENYDVVTPGPDFAPSAAALKRRDRAEKTAAIKTGAGKSSGRSLEMNEDFLRALATMEETGKNIFITGRAGTGKSTLLAHFCRTTSKQPVVLAPTGVAALNVRGQTIHRFFNFYVDVTPEKIFSQRHLKPRKSKLFKSLKTIIIDEISMVRADLMDCVEMFLRLHGPAPSKPFGGVQMIFVGDLYQLPPVVMAHEKAVFSARYRTPYFFSSRALENEDFEIIELEKVYRQKDAGFIGLLNRVRDNTVSDEDIEAINLRLEKDGGAAEESDFSITLSTTNSIADSINLTRLAALPGEIMQSNAVISGSFGTEYFPTMANLSFKIGAQIMLLNNDQSGRWVNGSIGIIEAVREDACEDGDGEDVCGEYLEVRLQDGDRVVEVRPHTWEVFKFGVREGAVVSSPAGTFTQYPFRLAWAITIHKSQGKTFRNVTLDVGNGAFAAGQIYVALSRCTSLEGLRLKTPVFARDIRTDSRIAEFFSAHVGQRRESRLVAAAEAIEHIRRAIENRDELEIEYRKSDSTVTSCRIFPLRMGAARHNGEDYHGLKAFSPEHGRELTFRMDRILRIRN